MESHTVLTATTRFEARQFTPDPKGNFIEQEDGSVRKLGLLERLQGKTEGRRYREVKEGRRIELDRVVTDAFVNKIVDGLQAAAYINIWKYHDSGTGVGAEVAGDTGLGTPCGEARDIGSQEEGATANIYKSIVTHTYAGTFAITEHGLFSAASNGTLMDRTKFAAVNVNANDKIEFTFTITFSSGG